MNKLALIFTITFVFTSIQSFATDIEQGKIKSASCSACHGSGGNSTIATFPKLAGQSKSYLLKQLQDFKSGVRVDAIMAGIVAPLTKVDMKHLSAYYAAQKIHKSAITSTKNKVLEQKKNFNQKKPTGTLNSTQSFPISNIKKGEIKAASCSACHGSDGNSITPAFPKLAGQSKHYLLKQLQDFKSGARIDAVMAGIVASLTNADMKHLSVYYSSKDISQNAIASTADMALGKRIYHGGNKVKKVAACVACHGLQGQGIPLAGFPALKSQHSAYIAQQLKLFRQNSINIQTGDTKPSRTNDYEGMMVYFTKNLTNKEIDAVAAYIANMK